MSQFNCHNPYAIYSVKEIKNAIEFLDKAPKENKQAQEMRRGWVQELAKRTHSLPRI